MKKFTGIILSGLLVLGSHRTYAQTQNVTLCAGQTTVLAAVNSSSLSGPSYSMNPGGITSPNPTFAVTPTVSTDYTLYVTGTNSNSAVVTTSYIYSVTLSGVTFSLSSPQAFTIGCVIDTAAMINVINVAAYPIPAGPTSYSFIPPGGSPPPPAGALSFFNYAEASVPGTWSVAVRNGATWCTAISTVQVVLNTVSPPKTLTTAPLNCSAPSAIISGPTKPGLTYLWLPYGTTGSAVTTSVNISAPTNSVAATLTLQVNDSTRSCSETVLYRILQNIYPPNAHIGNGLVPACTVNTLMLTNSSISGIPLGVFSATNPVEASHWKGPSPQVPLTWSTFYVAHTPGIYSLTVIDQNNGCTDSTTLAVDIAPSAAFVHSVSNGVASFSTTSAYVGANTSYYWDFGDGTFSGTQHPVHTYQNAGSHLVKLKVSNTASVACSDSVIQSVNITGVACNANSSFSLSPTATAQVWNAIPAYPWNIAAAEWQWGDGSNSNTLYTSHQYSAPGMYNICLSVTVSCVATSSTCSSYSVFRSSHQTGIIAVNVVDPSLSTGFDVAQHSDNRSVKITPNPNSGTFRLQLNGFADATARLAIYDITGRLVSAGSTEINSGFAEVNFDEKVLQPGIYFVNVDSRGITSSVKMIVDR